MRTTIIGLFFALLSAGALRAEQPIFTIGDQEATTGQIINVNVTVDNFTNIISAQFSVNWDQSVLEFRTVKNFNAGVTGLNASNFGTAPALVNAGQMTFSWIEGTIMPVSIPDGALFFTIEFEVIGVPCDNSSVAITGSPAEIEVAEAGEVSVGLVANNGSVSVPGTGCAQAVQFIGNAVNGPCGGQSCVQFTVENFTNVGTMEFSLVYNPAILTFREIKNFAPLLGFGSGNTNLVTPGLIRVIWFNGNVVNESLTDGTVLFEICFDVIGAGGQTSQIAFGNSPPPGITDIDNNAYDVQMPTPASITAQCALEGFALLMDTVCTMPNGEICADVRVHDFEDIQAMGFSINWNPNVFEFDRVQGFGLAGLGLGNINSPTPGQLVVVWLEEQLNCLTIPDYTSIFTLCLNAKGAAGTSSPITFSDTPLTIEIVSCDSVLDYTLLHGRGEIKQSCETCDFNYSIATVTPSCPRDANGVVDLTVIENCPETPTYLWSTGATSQDLSNVGAGVYTVTITLGSSVVTASATITDPPPITVTAIKTDPTPISAMNGSVNVTVSGGQPPFTYTWSNGATTEDLTNIGTGVYTVTITDSRGCQFIPDPYSVGAEVAAAITNVSCPGGNNGAINLGASFGTSPYTFLWNTTPPATTEDIGNLAAGTYCVTITDALNATRDTCFVVGEPAALATPAAITNDIDGNCAGAIDLSVSGGMPPFAYAWSNGATTQDIASLCPGQYCVTVSYGQGCISMSCFTVMLGNLGINLVVNDYNGVGVSCAGECDGEIIAQVSGGSAPLSYAWSNGSTQSILSNLCAGTYSLTVTDAGGSTSTASVTLTAPLPIDIQFTATLPSDFGTADGSIFAVVNGGNAPYAFDWFGPVAGNTASLNNIPAGTYTLLVTDENGCTAGVTESLLPGNTPCYQGITVFTPNSDGRNDYLIITCVLDLPNRLYIYNRFGALVYETADYANTWVGVDGDGQALPDGGYYWILEVNSSPGAVQTYRGTVNLLRSAD